MDPIALAKSFVEEKLAVDIVQDKSDLLDKIVRAFFEKIPFQNISTSVLPPEERFPTEEVVVSNATSLKGGLNVHNNWFLKLLLDALGYEAHFLAAKIQNPRARKPSPFGSHFAVLVKDLKNPGDLHLVDVGSGYPVFKAVPLDELPYTATDVTHTYRFVEDEEHWHSEHKDSESDDWTRFASYEKVPTVGNTPEVFKAQILEFLQEDWLLGGITAVHYPQPRSPAIPDIPDFSKDHDYVVYFNNDTIIFKNSTGFTWKEEIPQDLTVSTLQTYFPNIPGSEIEKKIKQMAESSARMAY